MRAAAFSTFADHVRHPRACPVYSEGMKSLPVVVRLIAAVLLACTAASAQTPQAAEARQSAGDWGGAEAIWRSLANAHPSDYRFWTSLGISLAHQNKFQEAIDAYRKALQVNPHVPQAELNLGLAYFKSGALNKAIAPLQAAAKAMPENEQAQLLLGMSFYGSGKYQSAVPHLQYAQQKLPYNRELRFYLAQAYLWSGQYDNAKQAFQFLLEHYPDSPQVEMLLGEAYDGLGQIANAIEAFRKAVTTGPLPDAHFGLGYLLWKSSNYTEAASEFKKELALDSKNYKALAYLGDAELKLGDLNAARRDSSQSIAVHDALWITHFDLGKLDAHKKQYQAALDQFKRAAEIEPSRAETHYRLAQIYRALGRQPQEHQELQVVARLQKAQNDELLLKVSGNKPPNS